MRILEDLHFIGAPYIESGSVDIEEHRTQDTRLEHSIFYQNLMASQFPVAHYFSRENFLLSSSRGIGPPSHMSPINANE